MRVSSLHRLALAGLAAAASPSLATPVRRSGATSLDITWEKTGSVEFADYVTKLSAKRMRTASHTASTRSAKSGVPSETPLFLDNGFWFSNFTIGIQSLTLLIDTGSSDSVLNQGVYEPGSTSHDLGKTFSVAYETTNPNGSGSESFNGDQYTDTMSFGGLTATNQTIGSVTSGDTFPKQGLVGFGPPSSSAFPATPFFSNLCEGGQVSACVFGLALGTDKTGKMALGGTDSSLFSGLLTQVPYSDDYVISAATAAGGKQVDSNVSIDFDDGTSVVFGPVSQVENLFKAAGITPVTSGGRTTGNYSCSSPPQLGFLIGGTQFNIPHSALAFSSDGDNCQASVFGSDAFGQTWLVGQPFFQGHYVEQDQTNNQMGFAVLK